MNRPEPVLVSLWHIDQTNELGAGKLGGAARGPVFLSACDAQGVEAVTPGKWDKQPASSGCKLASPVRREDPVPDVAQVRRRLTDLEPDL